MPCANGLTRTSGARLLEHCPVPLPSTGELALARRPAATVRLTGRTLLLATSRL
jgi:hypothetical protein